RCSIRASPRTGCLAVPIEAREQQPARAFSTREDWHAGRDRAAGPTSAGSPCSSFGSARSRREYIEDAVGAAEVDAAVDNRGRAEDGAARRPRGELCASRLVVDPQVMARADEDHAVGDARTAGWEVRTGVLPHRAAGGAIEGNRQIVQQVQEQPPMSVAQWGEDPGAEVSDPDDLPGAAVEAVELAVLRAGGHVVTPTRWKGPHRRGHYRLRARRSRRLAETRKLSTPARGSRDRT